MQLQFKNNFWGYFRFFYSVVSYRLFIVVALSMLIGFVDGFGLAMFIPLLQSVDGNTPSTGDSMGHLHFFTALIEGAGLTLTLNSILVIIIALLAVKGLIKFLEQNYQAKVLQFFMKKTRYALVSDVESLSFNGYLNLDAGSIQNTFIAEVQRMSQAARGYFRAIQAFLMLSTYVFLAFMANFQFAFLVAVSAAISNLIYTRIYKKVKLLSNEVSRKGDDFNGLMIEAIHNFKYLKSTNNFSKFVLKIRTVINHTENINKRTGFYNAITTGIREPIVTTIVICVIVIQVNWLGGTLTPIILTLLLFYRGLNYLMGGQIEWQYFIQHIGAINSVVTISTKMQEMAENTGRIQFKNLLQGIALNEVTFGYGEHDILSGVSIDIPKNKTVALVGSSGSGKTTLANMVCGLLHPKQGTILVDGYKLSDLEIGSYRSKIGYISQEASLFNDTIFNNITFWAEPTPENNMKFWEVTRMAALEDFILAQPGKEEAVIGDNGILISGGQKQRIAIARELFKNPEILLLDEATSALDTETERIIQENIDALRGKFTILIIAHRLSTIKKADTIYLLEKGTISCSGSYEELCNRSERFKKMVGLQVFDSVLPN